MLSAWHFMIWFDFWLSSCCYYHWSLGWWQLMSWFPSLSFTSETESSGCKARTSVRPSAWQLPSKLSILIFHVITFFSLFFCSLFAQRFFVVAIWLYSLFISVLAICPLKNFHDFSLAADFGSLSSDWSDISAFVLIAMTCWFKTRPLFCVEFWYRYILLMTWLFFILIAIRSGISWLDYFQSSWFISSQHSLVNQRKSIVFDCMGVFSSYFLSVFHRL